MLSAFFSVKRKKGTSGLAVNDLHGLYTFPVTSLIVIFFCVAASKTVCGMGSFWTGTSKINLPVSSLPCSARGLNGLSVIFAPAGYFLVNSLR